MDGVGSRDPTAISTDKNISDNTISTDWKFFSRCFQSCTCMGKAGFGTVGHTFCRGLGWARDHHSVCVLFLLRHENPKDSVAHEKVRSIYFPRQEILSWTLSSTLAWFVPTFVKIMCKWVIPPSIWLSMIIKSTFSLPHKERWKKSCSTLPFACVGQLLLKLVCWHQSASLPETNDASGHWPSHTGNKGLAVTIHSSISEGTSTANSGLRDIWHGQK